MKASNRKILLFALLLFVLYTLHLGANGRTFAFGTDQPAHVTKGSTDAARDARALGSTYGS